MKHLFRRLKAPTPRNYRFLQIILIGYATAFGGVIASYDGPAPIWMHLVGATLTTGAALCEFATHPEPPSPPAE